MNLAPIVLFVYNRPEHTLKTLKALKANTYADESTLYIYADGLKKESTNEDAKNVHAVRQLLLKEQWCKEVIITEQPSNQGLAKSIINGVSEILNKHNSIIVLEDDIVTSSGFIKYMNEALSYYQNNDKVMHISGYMYPHNEQLDETFFYNVTLCWGWATWKDCWKHFNDDAVALWNEINTKDVVSKLDKFGSNHLSRQLAFNITGKLNTWFIKWHASVLLKNGFTLFPKASFVDNIGFDNSGVHNGSLTNFDHKVLIDEVALKEIELVESDKAAAIIKRFYSALNESAKNSKNKSLKKRIKNKIRKTFYNIFPELKFSKNSRNKVVFKNAYTGKHVKIYPKAKLNNSIVGDYSYIAQNAIINNTTIGKFCSIGPNLISGWGMHPTNGISTHPMFYSTKKQNGVSLTKQNKLIEVSPITIGNDVFIGMNVTILDGVTIGNGAVIGAGAVVSKDIPDFAIAVGNPISIVKYRFDDTIINALLEKQWWNCDEEDLQSIEQHFFDVEEYLKSR